MTSAQSIDENDIDFEYLDQMMLDSGLSDQMVIEQPSQLSLFLRQIADPILVKIIVAFDYLKYKWQHVRAVIYAKLFKKQYKKYEIK